MFDWNDSGAPGCSKEGDFDQISFKMDKWTVLTRLPVKEENFCCTQMFKQRIRAKCHDCFTVDELRKSNSFSSPSKKQHDLGWALLHTDKERKVISLAFSSCCVYFKHQKPCCYEGENIFISCGAQEERRVSESGWCFACVFSSSPWLMAEPRKRAHLRETLSNFLLSFFQAFLGKRRGGKVIDSSICFMPSLMIALATNAGTP